jgi:predicted amino acid dehydrogenase
MKHVRSFAFIAHYVEPWNWLLNFRVFSFLHRRPDLRVFLFPLSPLCWIMSVYYLFRRQPFQVVDSYQVQDGLWGYTILVNHFAWHFLFPSQHKKIRERILAATRYAQDELGVHVVGLGALTKAETVTQGGVWLTNQVGVDIPIVHGDTCTAWFVIKRLEQVAPEPRQRTPIVMIGPTSKIGRAVMLYLASRGFVFKAYTQSKERFLEIQEELPEHLRRNLIQITDLSQARDCRIWVTGKSKPDSTKLLRFIPDGSHVINFAVPDPLSDWDLHRRRDLTHIEGGLVQTPAECGMRFTMRLTHRVTYACTAGTMIHAWSCWTSDEVGEVHMDQLTLTHGACTALGLDLVPIQVRQSSAAHEEAV